MIYKAERIHRMLFYIVSYLIVAISAHLTEERIAELQLNFTQIRQLNADPEVAPDILDDRNFAIALSFANSSDLSVQIIGPQPNISKSNCIVPYKLAVNSSSHPIRRLSRKTILLTVIDKQSHINLILLNTNNCNYTKAYDDALPESHYIFSSDDPSDEKFTLIAYGKDFCRGYHWCQVFFNPSYRKFQSLDFEFPWKKYDVDIQPATSFDDNNFVIRFTDEHGVYKIRLYDTSAWAMVKYQDLFAITADNKRENYPSKYPSWRPYPTRYYYNDVQENVRSSGLSYCWTRNRTGNLIECAVYRNNGSVLFKYHLLNDYQSSLLHVKSIPNGLVLFSKKENCSFSSWKLWRDCQEIRITVIRCINNNCTSNSKSKGNELVQMKQSQYTFDCLHVEGLKVQTNDIDDSIKIEYLCNWTWSMSYHVLHMNLKHIDYSSDIPVTKL